MCAMRRSLQSTMTQRARRGCTAFSPTCCTDAYRRRSKNIGFAQAIQPVETSENECAP
jgi:hypothetical protein